VFLAVIVAASISFGATSGAGKERAKSPCGLSSGRDIEALERDQWDGDSLDGAVETGPPILGGSK
jgi:hypothetical protein